MKLCGLVAAVTEIATELNYLWNDDTGTGPAWIGNRAAVAVDNDLRSGMVLVKEDFGFHFFGGVASNGAAPLLLASICILAF